MRPPSHPDAGPTSAPRASRPDGPAGRRERERAEREDAYLAIARRILLADGYLGLTMDRVAAQTEFSKGTLYQHFRNKEELVVALGERITRLKAELFERALEFEGRARERICAVGVAYQLWASRYPDDIRVTQILKSRSVSAKVRPELRDALSDAEARCCEVLVRITEEAIAAGDLTLPAGRTPGQLVFGLWALSWGSWTLALGDFDLARLEASETAELVEDHANALLDGHGFRPLSDEWDYERTFERIATELFRDLLPPSGPPPASP